MLIHFHKGKDKSNAIRCKRADGTETWCKLADSMTMHDIVHFAAESVLKTSKGFYGILSSGVDITDFENRVKDEFSIPMEAIQMEYLVGGLWMELYQGRESNILKSNLKAMEDKGIPAISELEEGKIDEMRAELQKLAIQWYQLKPGDTLTLEFSI